MHRVLFQIGSITIYTYGLCIALALVAAVTMAYYRTGKFGRNADYMFNGGIIPTYMVVKAFGLTNTRWAMVLPSMISAWNMFMMRNFFSAIPEALVESANLDGANPLQTLVRIVLPCSLASIATIGLFYAVAQWNAWFDSMIYITNVKLLPMQNILRNIVISAQMSDLDNSGMMSENFAKAPAESLKAATIIVGTVPILVVYRNTLSRV